MAAIAVTIAGSDSGGGAGIQADLKAFSARGVYGASVITALTAQNTLGVQGIYGVSGAFVLSQMRSVFGDLTVGAVKTGMLANTEVIGAVSDGLSSCPTVPLVVDPVMVATSGDVLLEKSAVSAMKELMFPKATLITPNLQEAAFLLGKGLAGSRAEMQAQAAGLLKLGAKAVLLKGGHFEEEESADLLMCTQREAWFSSPRVTTRNTHGTGCTLSAAIAAEIAKGADLGEAVGNAKTYIFNAISQADDLQVGSGSGPVNHFYELWPHVTN
ncbi:bifunctional hydroxymethylpyrimidine kinase/phosphomethylpyrimidine kinase [Polycladidibacter hongkongensis]|uniref:bifunctional hydroxymethylpyrimidine kinase/phosphomethylpyrimidine kinase n=1 Tax=Polycladidibacter hongkongensis TaxID=1647556 RepID=UPI00082B1FF8|nr:bifunctional hydroxymethylpyrimidine kinase/phosphomethylpyrimidine kinase [Pseudovibrio hongkongensis]